MVLLQRKDKPPRLGPENMKRTLLHQLMLISFPIEGNSLRSRAILQAEASMFVVHDCPETACLPFSPVSGTPRAQDVSSLRVPNKRVNVWRRFTWEPELLPSLLRW